MKTLYLDCGMGAAGDMLSAALLELMPFPEKFTEKLNSLAIPDVVFKAEKVVRCGVIGTRMTVKIYDMEESEIREHNHDEHDDHDHEHEHATMQDIENIVEDIRVTEEVKADILAVYKLLAEAESHVHGKPVSEIHFHEVGTLDAIADITATCLMIHELAPDVIIASPVHVGSGSVKCAHGELPVPAPATEYLLRGVPIFSGSIQGELCTPTGAALLRHFVNKFGAMPLMTLVNSGYGMGKTDFERANCVRAMIGESADPEDFVTQLTCTIDDMTPEDLSYAGKMLFAAGAMDVYTISVGMKKSRIGTMLCVLCNDDIKEEILEIIFKHTTTIGVREELTKRHVLYRKIKTIDTPYGKIHKKTSIGYGVKRVKYEHDDLERAAAENYLSLDEVRNEVIKIDHDRNND